LLEHELLLGQEVVREDPVEFPNLVQQGKLGRGVVTVVADEFAHVGSVLLLDVGAIVAVAGAGAGESDLVGHAVVEQVVIDELGPVVGIDADDREREHPPDVHEGSNTHFSALFFTDRFTVHPVAMSVTVRVKQCSPDVLPPS